MGFAQLLDHERYMNNLAEVAETLKAKRQEAGLTQAQLAARAGVPRVTLARMETASQGDMSLSSLLRLLAAMGLELRVVQHGHRRTLDDILAEQRGER
jgi:transcriptional regulator with XRE-family HTH domain